MERILSVDMYMNIGTSVLFVGIWMEVLCECIRKRAECVPVHTGRVLCECKAGCCVYVWMCVCVYEWDVCVKWVQDAGSSRGQVWGQMQD